MLALPIAATQLGLLAGLAAFLGVVALGVLHVMQRRRIGQLKRLFRPGDADNGAVGPFLSTSSRSPAARIGSFKLSPKVVAGKVVYLALGVTLLVGVGIGVRGLATSDGDSASRHPARTRSGADESPRSITVAVLNGTTRAGLAASLTSSLAGAGFKVGQTTGAAQNDLERTVVLGLPGEQLSARRVARFLGIDEIRMADSLNRQIAGSAEVIVLLGADGG